MSFPRSWRWPAVMVALVLSVLLVGGGAVLLALGAANPPRAESLLWEDTTLDWASGSQRQALPQWYTSPQPLSADEFSLEVVGTLYADAPTLSAWGIWFQIGVERWLLVGINGHQFVTARYCDSPDIDHLLTTCTPAFEPTQQIPTAWKPFHLIQPINQANRIQLSRFAAHPDVLTLRFGGEWMWDIELDPPTDPVLWGIWAVKADNAPLTFVQWTASRIWGTIE